jgi:predicted permease
MNRRSPGDFAAEIASHLAHEADERGAAAAERAFGNTLQAQERFWESTRWWPGWVRAAGRDTWLGLRRMRRNPGVTLAALLVLGLGLAAVLVVYAAADLLVLGRLPYPHADRLMLVRTATTPPAAGDQLSSADFSDLRQQADVFAAVAGISPVWDNVADPVDGRPAERLSTLFVSAALGPMLDIHPRLGRWFSPAEDRAGAPHAVAVISDRLWRQRFAARADVLGQPLRIGGQDIFIVGVLPADFHYLGEPVAGSAARVDLWMPLALNPLMNTPRSLRWLNVLALRRPGVTARQAEQQVAALGANWAREYAAEDGGLSYSAAGFADWVRAPHRAAMMLLLGAVALLLLLACASVAGLLLEQALARRPEMAMRRALGASRFRLLRQLAAEHLALAGLGTALGLAGAWAGLRWLAQAAPPELFGARAPALSPSVLAVAALALVATALACGLAPAWTALHQRAAAPALITGGLGRLRATLVGVQMALALALLISAGLLLTAFLRVTAVAPGFDAAHAVTLSTQLPPTAQTLPLRLSLDQKLLARLQTLPGITAVGVVSRLPLSGKDLSSELWIEGKTYAPGQQPQVQYRVASSGYFSAMGIPLIAGESFSARDDADPGFAATRVLINQAAARRFWPAGGAVGQRVRFGANPQGPWATIIGVVGDVKAHGLEAAAPPTVFRPLAHSTLGAPIVVARTSGDPAAALRGLQAAVHRLDPSMPVYDAASMGDLLAQSLAQRRLLLVLLSLFAVAGTLVAIVGLYAAMAQSVARRRRELALRLALGAAPARLGSEVMAQAALVTAAGLAAGTLLAMALGQLLRSLLFETSPLLPGVYALAAAGLGLTAAFAALLPARRAARTSPATVLREL